MTGQSDPVTREDPPPEVQQTWSRWIKLLECGSPSLFVCSNFTWHMHRAQRCKLTCDPNKCYSLNLITSPIHFRSRPTTNTLTIWWHRRDWSLDATRNRRPRVGRALSGQTIRGPSNNKVSRDLFKRNICTLTISKHYCLTEVFVRPLKQRYFSSGYRLITDSWSLICLVTGKIHIIIFFSLACKREVVKYTIIEIQVLVWSMSFCSCRRVNAR